MGAVAWFGVLAALVSGCGSGPLHIQVPGLHGADASDCSKLVHALPDRLAGQRRRPVNAAPGFAAAWGDPAIVLRCGVPKAAGLTKFSTCQTANGVDWFIPERQMQGRPEDIVMTTVGRAQNVEVDLPAEYWPPAAAMVGLAPAVKSTIRKVRPCL